ncbi:hypothetical protein EDC04DRAFT_2779975 [Pisolithus marmoratus]|nr:hypothetical protein EDC04DRAFT_2779975 [Pisolithus marmoratus]
MMITGISKNNVIAMYLLLFQLATSANQISTVQWPQPHSKVPSATVLCMLEIITAVCKSLWCNGEVWGGRSVRVRGGAWQQVAGV